MTSVQKILLHVGMAKSGSTALQHAFRRDAANLARQGVLYPEVKSSKVSHKFLAFRLCEDHELPGHFRNLHGGSEARKQACFERDWAAIKSQIARQRPHTLLLSSEHLFYGFGRGRGGELQALLAELSPCIEVVAYVRQPSAYYLSETQQVIKGSARLPAPAPVAYRDVLVQCASLFQEVHVRPFERSLLQAGDVVTDFYTHFLPGVSLPGSVRKHVVNETLSAESMALLQDYLRLNHPGRDRMKPLDIRRLIDYVRFAERYYGLRRRPALLPEVADYLDHASVDLLWLKAAHGIEYPGIRYEQVGERPNPFADAVRVSEVCVVDAQRQADLQLRVLSALLSPRIPVTFAFLARLMRLRQPWLARLARRFAGINPPPASD